MEMSPRERIFLGKVAERATDAEFEEVKDSGPVTPEPVLRVVRDEEKSPVVNTAKEQYKEFVEALKNTNTGLDEKAVSLLNLKRNLGYAENEDPAYKPEEDPSLVKRKNETAISSSAILKGGRRIAYAPVEGFPFGRPKVEKAKPNTYEAKASFENTKEELKKFEKEKLKEEVKVVVEEKKPEQILKTEIKTSTVELKENKKVELDGLVEFQTGKMGLLDVSDPRAIEEKKSELIGKIENEIPNFFSLSKEKQLYALDKLKQRTLKNVDTETRNAIVEADKLNKKGWIFGSIARNLSQEKRISNLRKETLKDLKNQGFEAYKDDLKQLTDFIELRGIDVKFGDKGNLVLQFVERSGENEKHKKLIKAFNDRASVLSDIPYNWTIDHAVTWQKKKYELVKHSYEKARKALMEYESKKGTHDQNAEKNLEFTNIDADIQMGQFLANNPGLEGKVNQFIKDNPVLAKASLMSIGWKGRGMVKAGAALGGGLAVLGAGTAVSAGIGGFTSWVRKRGEFRDLEAQKRAGVDIGKKEGVKEFIDLAGYTKRMNALIEQAKKTTDEKSKQRIIETLKTRLTILQDRTQNLGAVKFGSKKEDLTNQFEYTKAVKEANNLILQSSGIDEKIAGLVYKKFDEKYLGDDRKDTERIIEIKKAFKKGALIGASAFVGGFIARDLATNHGEGLRSAWQSIEDESKKIFGALQEKLNKTDFINSVKAPTMNMSVPQEFHSIKPISEISPTTPANQAPPTPSVSPSLENTIPFKAEAGNRGVIGMFDDLQKQIRNAYAGKEIPAQFKDITSKSPEDLAKMFGAYRPTEGGGMDSLLVQKGANISLENGNLVFHDGLGHDQILNSDHGFQGNFTDSHTSENAHTEFKLRQPEYLGDQEQTTYSLHEVGGGNEHSLSETSGIHENSPVENSNLSNGNVSGREFSPNASNNLETSVPKEGLALNTPEIRGTLKVTYDDFGRVMKMDLGTTGSVAEVNKFLATPDKFLVEDLKSAGLKFPTRSFGTSELSAIKPDCADYLKYRAFLKTGNFKPGSPEYRYLIGQMNLKAEAIHGRVGNIFRPLEEDRLRGGLTTAGAPNVKPIEAPAIATHDVSPEKTIEPIKTKDLITEEPKVAPTPKPAPSNIVRMEGSSAISETPSGRLVHFDSKSLNGEIIFKKSGADIIGLEGLGVSTSADGSWQKFLEDNYGDFAKKLSVMKNISEDVARKRVYLAAQSFVKYKTLIENGGLEKTYPEGQKFLERQLSSLLKTYGDVLKDEKYEEIIRTIKPIS